MALNLSESVGIIELKDECTQWYARYTYWSETCTVHLGTLLYYLYTKQLDPCMPIWYCFDKRHIHVIIKPHIAQLSHLNSLQDLVNKLNSRKPDPNLKLERFYSLTASFPWGNKWRQLAVHLWAKQLNYRCLLTYLKINTILLLQFISWISILKTLKFYSTWFVSNLDVKQYSCYCRTTRNLFFWTGSWIIVTALDPAMLPGVAPAIFNWSGHASVIDILKSQQY